MVLRRTTSRLQGKIISLSFPPQLSLNSAGHLSDGVSEISLLSYRSARWENVNGQGGKDLTIQRAEKAHANGRESSEKSKPLSVSIAESHWRCAVGNSHHTACTALQCTHWDEHEIRALDTPIRTVGIIGGNCPFLVTTRPLAPPCLPSSFLNPTRALGNTSQCSASTAATTLAACWFRSSYRQWRWAYSPLPHTSPTRGT